MKILCKNKNWKLNEDYDIDKILYLIIDKPDEIILDDFYWKNKTDQSHRDYDLPAFVSKDGCYLQWRKNDNLHRENKSAIIQHNGSKEYWVNGNFIKK